MSRSPPQSQANSLLNLLNPYTSVGRSRLEDNGRHSARGDGDGDGGEPESPSAMLLRELQGDDDDDQERERERYIGGDREGMSPTPTPVHRRSGPLAISSSTDARAGAGATTISSEDEDGDGDGDGPSQSLLYGKMLPRDDDQNTSIEQGNNRERDRNADMNSPGPFKLGLSSSSTSNSGHQSRSASTSPGPSTISQYASGLEMGETTLEPSVANSPITNTTTSARNVPTFRDPPVRPGISRTTSSSRRKSDSSVEQGYLDPPLSSSRKGKGKGKAKSVGGRKYHQVPQDPGTAEEQEDEVGSGKIGKQGLNEYEKALWKWVNVDDLDGFLQEVYAFYKGKGFYCIFLAKLLNLLTTFFVIGFSTFLLSCIDYSRLWSTTTAPDSIGRLDDVLIDKCLISGSIPHMLFILTVMIVYAFQLFTFLMQIPRLLEMSNFYTHLLGIPDVDIQTLPWPEIVRLIGDIRKHNPITSLSNDQTGLADLVGDDLETVNVKKLDAHDVANRILRQENYLIALFNKDLLDLQFRFPLPNSLSPYIPTRHLAPLHTDSLPTSTPEGRKYISFGANTLTKALEWNLRYCLMGYLFDRRGQVRKEFVKERRRKDLVDGLKHRFVFMGCLNLLFSPFIVIYLLIYSFFRYFEEYHKNPSSIGGRQYTPYAQWKFREFNELPHLFERRLDRSYPVAKEYIDQFPKERTALVMRFVAFIAGSFAAVLLSASLIDPDLFLHFEITPHRTVLFYLGIFGSILAMARGMVPEENLVFDPEASLRELVYWTHYLPGEWKGRLHSQAVHAEFGTMFQLKIQVFFTELLSVLLTPWILFFSLPPCSATIIDFFREFTVHVDGIGYVCSFAVFDFQLHGNSNVKSNDHSKSDVNTTTNGPDVQCTSAPASTTGARKRQLNQKVGHAHALGQRDYKMEKSFLHFKATHPDWQPDLNGSIFLDKVSTYQPKSKQASQAGGRGLGLGSSLHGSRVGDERARSYERTWGAGSHLRPRNGPRRGREMYDSRLESMREDEEDEGHEGEVGDGWDNRPGDDGDRGSEEEGFMRDAGMVGLLQQVLNR